MIEVVDENGVPLWMRNRNRNRVALVNVVDHCLPYETHNLYDVTFHTHTIRTLLTSSPSHVDSWLSDNATNRRGLMVGLDMEWRPNTQPNMHNPVATLQLCIANRCLVFQILHSPSIPRSLDSFLADPAVTFFGVGIRADAEKLLQDYNLHVANVRDLRPLAAGRLGDRALNQAGLKALGLRVLGLEVQKPTRITMSRWDHRWLSAEQVQYAAVDAFLSYQIACLLSVGAVW